MSEEKSKQGLRMDEFLNPASMLTPGLAGSVTMLITNALSLHFQVEPSWTGLLVSFLCGTLVFVSSVHLAKKLVYYVLNSLIIFSVAAGTSGFAATATRSADWNIGASPALAASPMPSNPASAAAQAARSSRVVQLAEDGASTKDLEAKIKDLKLELDAAQREAELAREQALRATAEVEALKEAEAKAVKNRTKFFKPWF